MADTLPPPAAYLYTDANVPEDAHPLLHSTMLVLAADRRPECPNETPLYTAAQVAQAVAEAVAEERERWQSLLLSAVQEAEMHARQRREFVIKVDERGWWCERTENVIRTHPLRTNQGDTT